MTDLNVTELLKKFAVRCEVALIAQNVYHNHQWTFNFGRVTTDKIELSESEDYLRTLRCCFTCAKDYPQQPVFTYDPTAKEEFDNQLMRQMFAAIVSGPLKDRRLFIEVNFAGDGMKNFSKGYWKVPVQLSGEPTTPSGLAFTNNPLESEGEPATDWKLFVPPSKVLERNLIEAALELVGALRRKKELEEERRKEKEEPLTKANEWVAQSTVKLATARQRLERLVGPLK